MNKKKECKFKRRSGNSHHSTNWCALVFVQFIHLPDPSPLARLCGHCECSGKRTPVKDLEGLHRQWPGPGLVNFRCAINAVKLLKWIKGGLAIALREIVSRLTFCPWVRNGKGKSLVSECTMGTMGSPQRWRKKQERTPLNGCLQQRKEVLRVGCCCCNTSPWSYSREGTVSLVFRERRKKKKKQKNNNNK